MNYEAVWKVLSNMITELRRKGETIKPEIMTDLRSAKTLIEVWKADSTCTECVPKIETYLENVESSLMLIAYEKFGVEFAEEWMKKLKEAREKTQLELKPKEQLQSIPKGKKWIRIQISMETPEKMIRELTKEHKLKYKKQENGYILVYGEEEKIKALLQDVAKNLRIRQKSVRA
jgi:hypothetical protein